MDRDAKVEEILDAAERLFLSDGFERTTIAAVARAAGVAGNTLYWYFPSKDDLLVAVLSRRRARVVAGLDPAGSQVDRALAVLAALDEVASLTATVHDRARHSAAVAAMHDAFHDDVSRFARAGFESAGLSTVDARHAATRSWPWSRGSTCTAPRGTPRRGTNSSDG